MARHEAELQKRNSALTQQWLESLTNLQNQQANDTQTRQNYGVFTMQQSLMNRQRCLLRDSSFQSDDSHGSSLESVLELRKPDPEEVLLGLGFGPRRNSSSTLGRIPARFLQPSKLIPQIDINKFLERYGENYTDLPQSVPPSPSKIRSKSN